MLDLVVQFLVPKEHLCLSYTLSLHLLTQKVTCPFTHTISQSYHPQVLMFVTVGREMFLYIEQ